MATLPLIGPSYDLDSAPAGLQRTVNMVPVPVEPGNERTRWTFKDVPGLVEAVTEWPIIPPTEGAFILFHFTNAEFSGAQTATDQTGATWTAADTNWLLPASSPAPKFGSGYLSALPESSTDWTRDLAQEDPDVPAYFSRPDDNAMSLDLWAYVDSGTATGNANFQLKGNGGSDTALAINIEGINGLYKFSAFGIGDVEVAITYDAWVHLRLCYTGGSIYSFVGGVLESTDAVDLSSFETIDSARIVVNNSGPTDQMALDEAYMVLGEALSTSGFTPPTTEWTL